MNAQDEIVMKLIHYFVTDKNYHPIVLHGAQNEIWLENLEGEYDVVRIVSNYIHNDEQLHFDLHRTTQIMKKIKKKTFSTKLKSLSIFTNLGDNVDLDTNSHYGSIDIANIKKIKDLNTYPTIIETFPDITKKTTFKEKGTELFMKITKDLNQKSETDAVINDDIFAIKKPIITYILIAINTIFFVLTSLYSGNFMDSNPNILAYFGGVLSTEITNGEYYRLITGMFLHSGLLHFLFNNYALYIIGPQVESFFGKGKFTIIYLLSGIIGNLMSVIFLPENTVGIGASGAIFGLMGALAYFGYHYRLYLGNILKSQIMPLILLNLFIGFMIPGIGNAAHIGGLIAGVFLAMACGIKYKSTTFEKSNGWILTLIYVGFLIYMVFFMK